MVRQALVGGRTLVEMTAALVLIVLSLLIIVFIVRTVQANMPR
jgi:competence protein ComGC